MLLMAAVLGAGCSERASAPTAPTTGPTQIAQTRTIVALGDSLTSGRGLAADQTYPALLEKMLRSSDLPFTVQNHGVPGDTTADGLRRLGAALDAQPVVLIVALGANDGLRGVPIAQIRANLEKIIEGAQALNVTVLLCGMEALPLHGWEYTVEFHRLFPALAAKYGVPLVPFLLNGVIGNQRMLQPDLVHPNAAGAAEIARTIWPYLQPLAVRVASFLDTL
jgi:acyl-CoA thioesterase I